MSARIQPGTWATIIAVCTVCALPCFAADSAVLRNGFSIRFQRRQDMGLVTRLYVDGEESSFVDVPTAEIDHIEAAPDGAGQATDHHPAQATKNGAERPVDINELVAAASGAYRLDPDLVSSVIRAESGFNVRAVSPKGAQGLMQLMPQTASLLGVQNAFDPQANVTGGTRYLRELLEHYNFDLIKALAAYNAGPQRVEQYGGVPPYYETRAYVARIVRDFNRKKLAQKNAAGSMRSQKSASANGPNAGTNRNLASTPKPQGSHLNAAEPISSSR
jgi:soluble lytic murein transglycosylase-like protein